MTNDDLGDGLTDKALELEETFEDEAPTWTEADLKELTALASQQLELERRVAEAEEALKRAKAQLFRVSSEEIPRKMDEIGMREFLLKSGERVSTRRVVKASIPKKLQLEAFAWLRENGHGDLVKNEVKALFGRGEDDAARVLLEKLRGYGVDAEHRESVHPGTLSAFVREQMEAGHEVPHDLLGVFEYQETKVVKA